MWSFFLVLYVNGYPSALISRKLPFPIKFLVTCLLWKASIPDVFQCVWEILNSFFYRTPQGVCFWTCLATVGLHHSIIENKKPEEFMFFTGYCSLWAKWNGICKAILLTPHFVAYKFAAYFQNTFPKNTLERLLQFNFVEGIW